MYLSNGDVIKSQYVVIDKNCNPLDLILWADEESRTYCHYVINRDGTVQRNDWGYPESRVEKNKEFKIVPFDAFREMTMKNNVIDKIKTKQGV